MFNLKMLVVCWIFIYWPMVSVANEQSSPLNEFFIEPDKLSLQSHQLSRRYNRAIVLLDETQGVNWAQRRAVLHGMKLPSEQRTDKWWQRYEQGLLQTIHAGFALKQPDHLKLPCIISVGSSFEHHVERGGLVAGLFDYNYHPYSDKASEYEKMVLLHEIGHCFENYDDVYAEAYADVFAYLVLNMEHQASEFLERQTSMRTMELLEGDSLHYSAHALNLVKEHKANKPDSIARASKIAHDMIQTMITAVKKDLKANRWFAEFTQNQLQIKLVDYQINRLIDKVDDYSEARRDYLTEARVDLIKRRVELEQFTQMYKNYRAEMVQQVVEQMYRERETRGDLYNEVEISAFRNDVETLLNTVDPEQTILSQFITEKLNDEQWMKLITDMVAANF
ncbi:hypothetical protein [Pleionea sp. CnH1-48]|uniref:hypothetical protein n=1 Tax=Pleionea sp. CnH1-48 TaxID=2954494 RepID=UPI0020977C31|nr:hypothetical protein [Pleionea sp. CnH1-48]MCO7226938.1 hypothetical protein [Pleionea sp. CnH1-48]